MALIRVDPTMLRSSAAAMDSMAGAAHGLTAEALSATSDAPSCDGQFGPAVQAIGAEAAARLEAIEALLPARGDYLSAKSVAFEEADNAFEIPQWIWDLLDVVLGMFVIGDVIDIVRQVWNFLAGEEVDDLVLILAVIGLALDAGWVDPIPAEEGTNVGVAVLKMVARKLPKGGALFDRPIPASHCGEEPQGHHQACWAPQGSGPADGRIERVGDKAPRPFCAAVQGQTRCHGNV